MTDEERNQELLAVSEAAFSAYLDALPTSHITLNLIRLAARHVYQHWYGVPEEMLRLMLRLEQVALRGEDEAAQMNARWGVAVGYKAIVDAEKALAIFEELEPYYQRTGARQLVVTLIVNQIAMLFELGRFNVALVREGKARALIEALGESAEIERINLETWAGLIHRALGDIDGALQRFTEGREIAQKYADQAQALMYFDLNEGITYAMLSRITEATRLLTAAQTAATDLQIPHEAARAQLFLGMMAFQQGTLQQAVNLMDAAYEQYAALNLQTEMAYADYCRGLLYLEINLLPESLLLGHSAEQLCRQFGQSLILGKTLYLQGQILQRMGKAPLAHAKLDAAALQIEGDEQSIYRWQLALARLEIAMQQQAFAEANLIREGLHSVEPPTPQLKAEWLLLCGTLRLLQGESAENLLNHAETLAARHNFWHLRIAATHQQGRQLEQQGQQTASRLQYQNACQQIRNIQQTLLLDEYRAAIASRFAVVYQDWLRLTHQDATSTPLQILSILSQIHNTPLAVTKHTELPPDAEAKIDALRKQWQALQLTLPVSANASELDRQSAFHTQHLLEKELTKLLRRYRVQHSSTAQPETKLLAALPQRLGKRVCFLQYYTVADQCHAIFVHEGGFLHLRDLAPQATIAKLLNAWRLHIQQITEVGYEPNLQVAHLYLKRLYAALIAPLAHLLTGKSQLCISLPTQWQTLPFAAFYNGTRYLVEQIAISFVLSAEELLSPHPPNQNPTPPHATVIGHSLNGQLLFTLTEAKQIGAQLSSQFTVTQLLEEAVNLPNLRHALRHSHIVHCAAHAVFRADNPLFSYIQLADGTLTASDIYAMTFEQQPLVVLSACETGRIGAGNRFGLLRSLRSAGAASVVTTLWPIEDTASFTLMQVFYQQWRNASVAEALRIAQRKQQQHTPHPFYWAGYTCSFSSI